MKTQHYRLIWLVTSGGIFFCVLMIIPTIIKKNQSFSSPDANFSKSLLLINQTMEKFQKCKHESSIQMADGFFLGISILFMGDVFFSEQKATKKYSKKVLLH